MAPIRIGIDLGESPIRVAAFVLSRYIVAQGTKDIKVNGAEAPNKCEVVEIFEDANETVKFNFGAPKFEGAVVVVPNATSQKNREAIAGAAASYNVISIINENIAVAVAYAEIVKPSLTIRLAVVSVTAGILDVSILSVESIFKFYLDAQETHPQPIEFEEQDAHKSSHSGPSGLIGLVGGAIGGAVKTLVVDPLEKVLGTVKDLLSRPKLNVAVDEVVFVGNASKSENLIQAVKEQFPSAKIWSPDDVEPEELAAFGAGVIAFKQLRELGSRPPIPEGESFVPSRHDLRPF